MMHASACQMHLHNFMIPFLFFKPKKHGIKRTVMLAGDVPWKYFQLYDAGDALRDYFLLLVWVCLCVFACVCVCVWCHMHSAHNG